MFMAKSCCLRVWGKVYKIIKGEVKKVRRGVRLRRGRVFCVFFFFWLQPVLEPRYQVFTQHGVPSGSHLPVAHPTQWLTPPGGSPLPVAHPSQWLTPPSGSPLPVAHPSQWLTPPGGSPLPVAHPSQWLTPPSGSHLPAAHPSRWLTPPSGSPLPVAHPSQWLTPPSGSPLLVSLRICFLLVWFGPLFFLYTGILEEPD